MSRRDMISPSTVDPDIVFDQGHEFNRRCFLSTVNCCEWFYQTIPAGDRIQVEKYAFIFKMDCCFRHAYLKKKTFDKNFSHLLNRSALLLFLLTIFCGFFFFCVFFSFVWIFFCYFGFWQHELWELENQGSNSQTPKFTTRLTDFIDRSDHPGSQITSHSL